MKVVWLNSGGKDADLALKIFKQQNPDAEIQSLTIEVADQQTLQAAEALANKHKVTSHFVLPFEQTRQHIKGIKQPDKVTMYWYFEVHFKGVQYASSNGFDYVLSGGDATPVYGDFDDLVDRVMDCMRLGRKVKVLRPLKNISTPEQFQQLTAKYGSS